MRHLITALLIFLSISIFAQENVKPSNDIKNIKKKIVAVDNAILKLNMEQNELIDKIVSNSHKPEKVTKLSIKVAELKNKIEEKEKEKEELENLLAEQSPKDLQKSGGLYGEWRSSLGWEQLLFKRHRNKFYGHWAGLEIGFNGFLSPENQLDLQGDAAFMKLDQFRSWAIGLNVLEFNFPIRKPNFGITTGLGFEWNHYRFSNNFILGQTDGKITPIESTNELTRNQLNTLQVNVPLIFEFQFPPNSHHRFHLGVGPMISYVLASEQEIEWENDIQNFEQINEGGLLLNRFKYGATVRFGFSFFRMYANYSMVNLFEKDKGPELNPFTVGIVLINL